MSVTGDLLGVGFTITQQYYEEKRTQCPEENPILLSKVCSCGIESKTPLLVIHSYPLYFWLVGDQSVS